MKKILELIAQKKEVHAKLPFYQFLRNTSISPQDKLEFVPCLSYFVMSFSELCRHVLREEPTMDKIQALINEHTYEDEDHWIWFLEDLQKLGYDVNLNFTDAVRFLWSDDTMVQRKVMRWLSQTAAMAKPIHRLVLVEAIECTADVFLETLRPVAEQIRIQDQRNLRYFNNIHSLADSGHEMHTEEMEELIGNIPLTVEETEEAIRIVHKTFEMFADFGSDLLAHAKVPKVVNSKFLYTYEMRSQQIHKVKPLGSYLVEAGLLTSGNLDLALIEQRTTGKRLGDVVSSNGWVSAQTIEYMIEKLVIPERQNDGSFITEEVSKTLVSV